MLEAVATNRRLADISLAWVELCRENYFQPKKGAQKEKDLNDDAELHTLFATLVKKNTKLHHLNLTGVGITQPIFKTIMTALRRSRSLQAVHLSHNPFLHTATIAEIQ